MWTEKYILSYIEQGSAPDLEGTRVGWNYDYSNLISCNIPPTPSYKDIQSVLQALTLNSSFM